MLLSDLHHPFQSQIEQYLRDLPSANEPASGSNRQAYLELIHGIVHFFKEYQNASGAIIDPYVEREIAYSTPSFALGAAILASNGQPELLDPAIRAMVHASRVLVEGQAPDKHPDFFTIFLITADRVLAPLVSPEAAEEWRTLLRRLDPSRIYRFQLGNMPPEHIHNWNAINVTGEYLRWRAGLGGDPTWWQRYIPFHLQRFNELGFYRDGELAGSSHPLAYDAVTRYTLSALLDGGYDEVHAEELRADLLRGALTSLFVQSPTGEWPGVGRSAHHTWNDAALAASYEWAASQLKNSLPELAGACKHGAHLAAAAIRPFIRPSGEVWIVRNHFDPAERHGFEEYSLHSTYNLWTAAALAFAFLFSDEVIPEQALPSEASAYAIDLGRDFHQVVAANRDLYLQIETSSDPATNPTGLVRVNRAGVNSQIGPSEGSVANPRYSVLGQHGALCYAPAWQDQLGAWHSLAGYSGDRTFLTMWATLSEVNLNSPILSFLVTWRGRLDGAAQVRAHYRLSPQEVQINYQVTGPVQAVRAELPVFEYDGAETSQVQASGRNIQVHFRGATLRLNLLTPKTSLVDTGETYSTRTGLLHRWLAEAPQKEISFSIQLG